jgi:hypothetical protein
MIEKAVDNDNIKNLNRLIFKVKEIYENYKLITIIFANI